MSNNKKKSSKKPSSANAPAKSSQRSSAFKMAEAKAEQIVNAQTKTSKDKAKGGKKQNRVAKYFKELKSEIKKVVWPSRKTVLNNTGVVLAVMCIAAVAVFAMDSVFVELFKLLVQATSQQ